MGAFGSSQCECFDKGNPRGLLLSFLCAVVLLSEHCFLLFPSSLCSYCICGGPRKSLLFHLPLSLLIVVPSPSSNPSHSCEAPTTSPPSMLHVLGSISERGQWVDDAHGNRQKCPKIICFFFLPRSCSMESGGLDHHYHHYPHTDSQAHAYIASRS